MTRIAFTADLHCDDFGSKIDPTSGLNARWLDTVVVADWIARDAKERAADVLIVGGDFTEQRHPAPWRVGQIGAALAAFNGPAIYVRGNHDGTRFGHSIVELLAARMDAEDIVDGRVPMGFGMDVPDVRFIPPDTAIAAIPYLDRHWLRAQPGFETVPEGELNQVLGEQFLTIARGLYARAKASEPEASTVLVVHQALAGGLMSDSQAAFLGDQGLVVDTRALGAIGFDAILAGHFHKHQVLSTDPLIAYAGSPYRTDFGEEHQPKGYLIVDIPPQVAEVTLKRDLPRASMEFVETPARRFVTIDVDAYDGRTYGDIAGAIVRVRGAAPDAVAAIRIALEEAGAFEVASIEVARPDLPAIEGGMAEGLAPQAALEEYFAGDEDREALVERGRAVLAEVAG